MAIWLKSKCKGYIDTPKTTTKDKGYIGKRKKTKAEPVNTCRICGQTFKGKGNTCPSCYEFIVQKAKEGR